MGKLVEAQVLRYYGNRRIKPGEQFVMADSDFDVMEPVLDDKGKPVIEDGVPKMKKGEGEKAPIGIVVIEENYEDPVFESEAQIKAKQMGKPKKREPIKKDEKAFAHGQTVQGGEFDIHPELGNQVVGQVRPASPAASSFVGSDVAGAKPETKDDKSDKKGSKSVI